MILLELPPIFHHLQVPLLYLNNLLALAIGPKHRVVQLGITLPVYFLLASQSLYKERKGEWGIRYVLECTVFSLAFTYIDWILLKSPDKEKWQRIRYDKSTSSSKASGTAGGRLKNEDGVPQTFWGRAWWGAQLAATSRYVGWTCQVKNVPVEVDSDYSRPIFVARKMVRAMIFYIMSDVCKSHAAGLSYGSWVGLAKEQPATQIVDMPFSYQFWCSWLHILIAYAGIEFANAAYGAVSVAFGLANPRDCPSAFGNLKELVTLRKAWSVVWHQQCRRLCSAPGIFVARNVLHLRKGSFASKYLQLFIAFGISGIAHAGASVLIHQSLEDDGALKFFLAQALIIMVEDQVIEVGKRFGLGRSILWRLLGFVWTVFALGASCQFWTPRLIQQGIWVFAKQPDFLGLGPKVDA